MHGKKDPTLRRGRSSLPQIDRQCVANRGRQWRFDTSASLRCWKQDLALAPMHILQAQADQLPGSDAVRDQHQEDGKITSPLHGGPLHRRQKLLQILPLGPAGQAVVRKARHTFQRIGQITRQISVAEGKAQEAAQRDYEVLASDSCKKWRLPLQIRANALGRECSEASRRGIGIQILQKRF